MGLLDLFKAASPKGQEHLQKLLSKAGQVDLPDKAVDQSYAPLPSYHVGAQGVESYDLNAPRVNNANAPAGIYSNIEKGKSDDYLVQQAEFTGKPRDQSELVTTGRNVFVAGADKPSDEMVGNAREMIAKNAAGASYADLPSHQQAYIDDKLKIFSITGDPTTLPNKFVSAQDKTRLLTDAGFDIMLRNGSEFVHLKPEQTRRTSAEFDPARKGENNWNASAAGLGTAGLLGASMLTPDAAMAGEMEDAIASDLQESQRWQAGVDKANESLQSDDPEIRELARAWLDEAGLLSDDRQAVIDARAVEEPLAYDPFGQPIYPSSTDMLAGGANYAASAAEGLARDIGGSAVGIFSPEMGRSIKDARSIPMGTEAQEFASRVANPIINAGVGAAVNELSEPVFFGRGPSPMDGLIYAATKAEEAGEMIPEGLEPYTDRAGNAIVTAAYAIPALRALMKAAR